MKTLFMKSKLLLILLLAVSCNYSRKELSADYSLSITDKLIKIPIETSVYPQSNSIQLFTTYDSVRYLSYLNPRRNEIIFFYLDSLKPSHKVSLVQEGRDGVGVVVGYVIQSLDSIFITSKGIKELFLVNEDGTLLRKIDYSGISPRGMACYSTTRMPAILNDNAIYLPRLEGNWNIITEGQMTSFNLCLKINKSDGKASLLPVTYPKELCETNSVQYQWVYGDDVFVYSFNRSHKLFITADFGQWKEVNAKSRYFDKMDPQPESGDPQDYLRYSCGTPSYEGILYDIYRGVYYRLCFPGKEIKKGDNMMQLSLFKPRFSILIMDKEFNIMGETMLPENRFYLNELFVAKEGLYISENNVYNENYDENYITYRLLKLGTK